MNGVTTPQAQAGVRVELAELPGGMGLVARQQGDGELLVLLNPHAAPERLRDDVQDVFGHLIGTGLLAWYGGPQEPGLP